MISHKNKSHYEIERKFLIRYPDISLLETQPGYAKAAIVQTYLTSEKGVDKRIRSWTEKGKTIYFKTEKRKLTGITREEKEEIIGEAEYTMLLKEADPAFVPLQKIRHRFIFNGLYFEIDLYPCFSDVAIMEVELSSEDQQFLLPDAVIIIKEVTGIRKYTNRTLARRIAP